MNAAVKFAIGMAMATALATTGCMPVPTPDEIVKGPMSYLQPGKMSESDLLLRFGTPSAQFDGERILTWRLGRTSTGNIGPASRVVTLIETDEDDPDNWGGTAYDLVVVFDEHRLVKRFSLVAVCDR